MPTTMKLDPVPPEAVFAVWRALQIRYGTRLIRKDQHPLMVTVGNALQVMGVLDREAFLKRFTTTLLQDIYAPFTLGVETEYYDCWAQIVVLVHEHVHVVQYLSEPSFPVKYLASKADRAVYEAVAYGTRLELEFWRYGECVTPIDQISAHILSYACGVSEVKVVASALEAFRVPVEARAIVNEPTVIALDALAPFTYPSV